MTKISEATAVAPTQNAVVIPTKKAVRIALTQLNKNGKINASFIFSATGENFNDFVSDTAQKIIKVMELQQRIKAKGGKNNVFNLTKSGEFELSITTATENGLDKLLNNFVFTLAQLGESNQSEILIDMIEGFKLLTE